MKGKKVRLGFIFGFILCMMLSTTVFAQKFNLTNRAGKWKEVTANPQGTDIFFLNKKEKGNIVFSLEINAKNLSSKSIRAIVIPHDIYVRVKQSRSIYDTVTKKANLADKSIVLKATDHYIRTNAATGIKRPVLVVSYSGFESGEKYRVFFNDKTVYAKSLKVAKTKKVKKGKTFTVVKSAKPESAKNMFGWVDGVIFKTSNKKIVSVENESGLLKARKKGTATITMKCYKTGKTYKCRVTVK